MSSLLDRASRFREIRDVLGRSVFGKTLREYVDLLEQRHRDYAAVAERICELGWTMARRVDAAAADPATTIQHAYVEFILAYLREYEQFRRTDAYSMDAQQFADVNQDVYQNPSYMQSYLLALLVSYAFFPHHFREYAFYRRVVDELADDASCIEFGCGHGLFSVTLLEKNHRTCESVDISPTAVAMTQHLLDEHVGEPDRYVCLVEDATTYRPRRDHYDFAICCGFLEHIPQPRDFLLSTHAYTASGSRMFVMVPVNTPLPDHLIHLRNLEEARDLLAEGGWRVVREEAIPTEGDALEDSIRERTPVIYVALCERD